MDPNIPTQPVQPEIPTTQPTVPLVPESKPKLLKWITIVIVIMVLIIISGATAYILSRNITSRSQNIQAAPSKTVIKPTAAPIVQTNQSKNIYFGKGSEGKYSFINVNTGEHKELIPQGYTLVSQLNYQLFPPFLILKKENELYSYSLKDKNINSIFGSSIDLKLNKDEQVNFFSSITEKDKFFIVINKVDLTKQSAYDGSFPILSTRTYSLDASTNLFKRVGNVKFKGCAEYDSKNERFFTWTCGEGSGRSIPLSITNLSGQKIKDIIGPEDFGLKQDDTIYDIDVQYSNGLFLALSKNYLSKNLPIIKIIDPKLLDPIMETYELSDEVKSQVSESYPYSGPYGVAIDKSYKTIIIGMASNILLLRFDSNKQIIKSKYVQEEGIYPNFIFINEGRLYYQAKGGIHVVSLDSWELGKSIPSPFAEEITLFNL